MRPVFVDLFCGAGGEHTGAVQAYRSAGMDIRHAAVNHWDLAVQTLALNHPDADVIQSRVEALDPHKVVPEGRVHTLWASPSCTHHSVACGGRPLNDQTRSQPFAVIDWLSQLYVERLWVENVPEMMSWGPLGVNGRPIQRLKGATFRAWIQAIESLGYRVSWRVLNCADYGIPQKRRRLFVQAVRGRAKMIWPAPTHSGKEDLFALPDWLGAETCIDWAVPQKPIHLRKKPLCENTLQRIERGIRRHWAVDPEPFIVYLRGTGPSQLRSSSAPMKHPLRTISSGGIHAGLVEPMFLPQQSGGEMTPVSRPLSTIATGGAISVLQPLLVEYYGNGESQPVNAPFFTMTTKDRNGLLEPTVNGLSFRMLQPHELSAGQGFPVGYMFAGNKSDVVRQIGNAVPPGMARALVGATLAG